MINNYKELIFWKRAFEATVLTIALCRKLPRGRVSDILSGQLIRASGSVGANIAEGFGRYKTKEYPRFLQIALGSANETDYWLTIIKSSFPSLSKEIELIVNKNLETIKMLATSLKTIRNNR